MMRAHCKTEHCPQGRIGDSAAYRQVLLLIANRQHGSVPPSHNCKPVVATRADGNLYSANEESRPRATGKPPQRDPAGKPMAR